MDDYLKANPFENIKTDDSKQMAQLETVFLLIYHMNSNRRKNDAFFSSSFIPSLASFLSCCVFFGCHHKLKPN